MAMSDEEVENLDRDKALRSSRCPSFCRSDQNCLTRARHRRIRRLPRSPDVQSCSPWLRGWKFDSVVQIVDVFQQWSFVCHFGVSVLLFSPLNEPCRAFVL